MTWLKKTKTQVGRQEAGSVQTLRGTAKINMPDCCKVFCQKKPRIELDWRQRERNREETTVWHPSQEGTVHVVIGTGLFKANGHYSRALPCNSDERHLVWQRQVWRHRGFADTGSFIWFQQVPQKALCPLISISSFNLQPWSAPLVPKDKYLALSSLLVGVSLDPAFCMWKSVTGAKLYAFLLFPLPFWGVGFDDPYGSFPTWDILWFYYSLTYFA